MKQIISGLLFLFCAAAGAQQVSRVTEYKRTFTTYPFSDPDPIPDPAAHIYPYNHFDGYTNSPVQKEWKVV